MLTLIRNRSGNCKRFYTSNVLDRIYDPIPVLGKGTGNLVTLNLGQLSAAGGATAICITVGTIIPGGYLPPFPGINDIKVLFENGVGIAGKLTVNTFGSVLFQTIDSGPYGGAGPNGFAGTSISWNTI